MADNNSQPPFNFNARLISGAILLSAATVAVVLPAVVEAKPRDVTGAAGNILQVIAGVLLVAGFLARQVLSRLPQFSKPQHQFLVTLITFAIWEAAVIVSTVAVLTGGEKLVSYVVTGLGLGIMLIHWRLLSDL